MVTDDSLIEHLRGRYGDDSGGYDGSDGDDADALADEQYWAEDRAVDKWLVKFPGGTPLLYPQLFVVKSRGGVTVAPFDKPTSAYSFLRLPAEVRCLIYECYFETDEKVELPQETALFPDLAGKEIRRLHLTGTNVELRFWLSTALLQTSQQLRLEATPFLFKNRVITVHWLPALPRFVKFLGNEGCAMVRYLDIWDSLDLQGSQSDLYRDIVMTISHFSHLQHLRIILSGVLNHRTRSWFDTIDWAPNGSLKQNAMPKMRHDDIESHWPEYEALKILKARKFTLACETIHHPGGRYVEFDHNYGAYPGLSQVMQSGPDSVVVLSRHVITGDVETAGDDTVNPTWQEADSLANKTIPLYNFVRDYFHKIRLQLHAVTSEGTAPRHNFDTFPTALRSTGSLMRDCAFCYLRNRHCRYHAVPDQPPFESRRPENSDAEEGAVIMEAFFKNMSFVVMKTACCDAVQIVDDPMLSDFYQACVVFEYIGWLESPIEECLVLLDAAVETGCWTGKAIDKEEVPPWDVMYRAVRSYYRAHRDQSWAISLLGR